MAKFPAATESVTRHRGGGRDENGKVIAGTSATLSAIAVAPGASQSIGRGRDTETYTWTVYFPLGTDISSGDEITVRGNRFRIVVNEWRPVGAQLPGGIEVLCVRGQG